MALGIQLLYRGSLSSCNYTCAYCPFGKAGDTRASLEKDSEQLARFTNWVAGHTGALSVFFTPWGEALIRPSYQRALVQLSHLDNVQKVAIQTNLSMRLDFLRDARVERVGLWCTFHPTQVTTKVFLAACEELMMMGVPFSVGAVGSREDFAAVKALRAALSPNVYLWVNARKHDPDYYTPKDLAEWESIDPLFSLNTVAYPSQGKACWTGQDVLSVDGDGTLRRCHFVGESLGNLFQDSLNSVLRPRPCPNATCGCHIGYIHRPDLELRAVYGNGLLERVADEGQRRVDVAHTRLRRSLALGSLD